jgi:hypothetical protein
MALGQKIVNRGRWGKICGKTSRIRGEGGKIGGKGFQKCGGRFQIGGRISHVAATKSRFAAGIFQFAARGNELRAAFQNSRQSSRNMRQRRKKAGLLQIDPRILRGCAGQHLDCRVPHHKLRIALERKRAELSRSFLNYFLDAVARHFFFCTASSSALVSACNISSSGRSSSLVFFSMRSMKRIPCR